MFWNEHDARREEETGGVRSGHESRTTSRASRSTSPTKLTFQMTGSYNPLWLNLHQFSQITPLPKAWDISAQGGAAGSGGCSSAPYGTARHGLRRCLYLLSQQAGIRPGQSVGHQQLADHVRHQSVVADRGRALAPGPTSTLRVNVTMVSPTRATRAPPRRRSVCQGSPLHLRFGRVHSLVAGNIDFGYLPTQDINGGGQESARGRGQQPPS